MSPHTIRREHKDMQHQTVPPDSLRPVAFLKSYLGISHATLERWLIQPELGFPPPHLRVRGHRYWKAGAIYSWVADQAAKEAAKAVEEAA